MMSFDSCSQLNPSGHVTFHFWKLESQMIFLKIAANWTPLNHVISHFQKSGSSANQQLIENFCPFQLLQVELEFLINHALNEV